MERQGRAWEPGHPSATSRATRPLPCPECVDANQGGHDSTRGAARIGNRRSRCATCNNFAQQVMRQVRKRMKDRWPDLYEKIRTEVEAELYEAACAQYEARRLREEAEAVS